MRTACTALALLLLIGVSRSADLTPLKGDAFKVEVDSIDDKQISYTADEKTVKKPIGEVLKIDFRPVGKWPADKKIARLELTDGSVLYCGKWLIKGKTLEVTLLAGVDLKIPVKSVAHILFSGEKESSRIEWGQRVSKSKGKEVLVIISKETKKPQSLEATLGDGNAAGTEIEAAVTVGNAVETIKRKLDTIHGLIFKRTPDPKAPPVKCKLLGTEQDVLALSSVTLKNNKLTVETPAKVKIEYPLAKVATLDYQKGRYELLAELTPTKTTEKPFFPKKDQRLWTVTRVTIGGVAFPRGIWLAPTVTREYDLRGDFREFAALVGLNQGTKIERPVILLIEGDGKELLTVRIAPGDKVPYKAVNLNIKDVQKLKISCKAEDDVDCLQHICLGDARLVKQTN